MEKKMEKILQSRIIRLLETLDSYGKLPEGEDALTMNIPIKLRDSKVTYVVAVYQEKKP